MKTSSKQGEEKEQEKKKQEESKGKESKALVVGVCGRDHPFVPITTTASVRCCWMNCFR